jgi:hypothetical protein
MSELDFRELTSPEGIYDSLMQRPRERVFLNLISIFTNVRVLVGVCILITWKGKGDAIQAHVSDYKAT